MIVGRVFPTSLSDHGVSVPVTGDRCSQRVGGRCRIARITARGRGVASAGSTAVLH
jgi:hypothetical protein